MSILKKDLVDPLVEALGVERSESLVDEVLAECHLNDDVAYSPEQGQKILERLKGRGGLVRILALNLSARLVLKGAIPP